MTDPQTLAGGRYLLVERLGEGGMATVYRGFDQRLQVWRAIKVLLPEYARKTKIIARFETEAQTMALLEHPHIVRVYDVDRDGDHAYIVMELVEGGSLVDWLERHGPMPARMAVQVIVETAQALQFAHDKDVIHRDIKPHNIMVDRDGVCRLTDFGIARAGDNDASLTKTGAVMGTWGYMAPEQRTDAKHVDARADVYALAATLYSLVTDKTPMDLFAAENDASMLEGVPEPLVPVLVRATEYRKERRFGSATEFASALLAVRDALPEDPAGTPSLQRAIGPQPAPPSRPITAPPRAPSETILPDGDHDTTGSFTMPPSEGDPTFELSGQHRAVYAPAPERSRSRAVPIVVALLIGGAAVAGGAVWVARPAAPPIAAPTPTAIPIEPVAPAAPTEVATTATLPDPSAPAKTVRPAPVAKTPREERPAPTPVAPAPIAPTAAVHEQRPGNGTTPAPVVAPEPVRPPEPVVIAPPEPPRKVQCIDDVDATLGAGDLLGLRAKTCLGQLAPVTLFYRPAGTDRWFSKAMAYRLGAWSASLPLADQLADGVEWYLQSDGVTYGSTSAPKVTKRGG